MTARQIGHWKLGKIPRVVGTISTLEILSGDPHVVLPLCDIAEVRLDLVMARDEAWLEHCWSIEHLARPVIATLRLKAEGGAWTGTDTERGPILKGALEHLSCIDVELQSELLAELGHEADRLRKPLIVSYHNFEKTPPLERLQEIATLASHACTRAIPKIATMLTSDEDLDVLVAVVKGFKGPISVLGMGERGPRSRTLLPDAGASLTYGSIDTAVAPGQVPSRELVTHFWKHVPGYAASRHD